MASACGSCSLGSGPMSHSLHDRSDQVPTSCIGYDLSPVISDEEYRPVRSDVSGHVGLVLQRDGFVVVFLMGGGGLGVG